MNRVIFATLAATAFFSANAFAAPSAKFAATWSYGPSLKTEAIIVDADTDSYVFDENSGYTLATIKVPQDKELLVGVSAEIGLVTDTSIKGKNGGAAKALAGSGANVIIFAVPVEGANGTSAVAEPGPVMLSARIQELDATLGGVIESCQDFLTLEADGSTTGTLTDPVPDGVITIALECVVTDEEIGLALSTLASHHFNFVLPNMDQGEYNLVAYFTTAAFAQVDIDELSVEDGGTVTGSAYSSAVIGKTMVTVQQVRAAAGGVIDSEIAEL
jgi:hypothetical protein